MWTTDKVKYTTEWWEITECTLGCRMEELMRSQKYDELAEYCEEEELKVRSTP